MAIKLCRMFSVTLSLAALSLNIALAEPFNSQVVQIDTRLNSIAGHPSWLLILRDNESQRVFPYIYDLDQPFHTWLAFSFTHNFRITVSELTFGPFAKIKNFCHLENLSFRGESLNIVIKGNLTPIEKTFQCFKQRYQDYAFPIANQLYQNPQY